MTMVTRLFPAGMTGLVMAVLIAALVSTIDSALNSLSTVFTMDIYVKKFRPDASQKQIVSVGRIVTFVGAIIAILLTLAIDSIKGLNLFDVFQAVLGFIAPPMSVVFLFGVFWKRTTTRAANFALFFGTIFSLGTGITYLFIIPEWAYWPHFLLLSFFIFVILAVLTWLVVVTDKNSKQEQKEAIIFGKLTKPDRKVWIVWIALIVVMIGMYILFNGH